MPWDTKLYVAGGFEGEVEDSAWFVTTEDNPQLDPIYTCNAEETDTWIWVHVNQSTSFKILILSHDTDIYYIGLPLINENKDIIIQTNPYNSKHLTYISILALKFALANDPDLAITTQCTSPDIPNTVCCNRL